MTTTLHGTAAQSPKHPMSTTRRKTLAATGAAVAALACMAMVPGVALAQAQAGSYPAKAIKLVVPYAPGGSADIAARLVTDEWGKALGGSLFIENKGGAGGNIGVDMVAKAAPDGYTIGL
jgi:tripartite-type tricarboxylate transporter receptor subunit TctC